jgi:hypothetical protein
MVGRFPCGPSTIHPSAVKSESASLDLSIAEHDHARCRLSDANALRGNRATRIGAQTILPVITVSRSSILFHKNSRFAGGYLRFPFNWQTGILEIADCNCFIESTHFYRHSDVEGPRCSVCGQDLKFPIMPFELSRWRHPSTLVHLKPR